jgi:hypothetical protein
MALPILETTKYELPLPSTGEKITYRPFLVKEEKILHHAQASENTGVLFKALKDVVNACTFESIDTNELTQYDLEYVFLRLRSASVGETISLSKKCEKCDEMISFDVNLDDIEIQNKDNTEKLVKLTDEISIKLKSPKLSQIENIDEEDIISSIACMISEIYDQENVYIVAEASPSEVQTFVESLSHKNLEEIQDFIKNQPKLSHTVTVKCKECGHTNKIELEGLQTFFS